MQEKAEMKLWQWLWFSHLHIMSPEFTDKETLAKFES